MMKNNKNILRKNYNYPINSTKKCSTRDKLADGCYFVPLGGTEEIGMNFNLFGIVNDGVEQWIIVDIGISLIKELGVSIKMASINYAIGKNIIGIICTHAHEDHIGALPYMLPRLGLEIPIYATEFTLRIIEHKMNEHGLMGVSLNRVAINSKFSIGDFEIQFIYVTHSIPEPNMILINFIPFNYRVLHTGDWKFDSDPILGDRTDKKWIQSIANNVDALICDSTNANDPEPTHSEGEAAKNLERIIQDLKNHRRVVVSCFASNVARILSLMLIAKKTNRKVVLLGRSLLRMYEVGLQLGYLPSDIPVVLKENLHTYVSEPMLVICTGSQGEEGAVLHRLSNTQMREFALQRDDVVIFSSRVIPGNEIQISQLKNIFVSKGIRVIDLKDGMIHVSGHPSQPDIIDLINICNPKSVITVHGYAMLFEALKRLIQSLGLNIFVLTPYNGALIKLQPEPKIIQKVVSGIDYLDGNEIISSNCDMLKMREMISKSGVIFITVGPNLRIICSTFGFINRSLQTCEQEFIKAKIIEGQKKGNLHDIIDQIKKSIRMYFKKKLQKVPVVIIHMV